MSDKYNRVFFEKSFNQQMAVICAGVEDIIRSGAKESIKAEGREEYKNTDIARLFEITRSDPKNLGLMRDFKGGKRAYRFPLRCSRGFVGA